MKRNSHLFTRSTWALLVLGMLYFGLNSCDFSPPEHSRVAQAERGKAHYDKYCSSCHGPDGKGLQIDSLERQPANLTYLTRNYESNEFPVLAVARMIDGRKLSKSHQDRDMPLWGDVFAQEELMDESQIKGRLAELIAYLMTIQEG
ncbi:MAG: cytochrome c [Phaeodactylibacter sp.]|nr:cytochrome c [Phaeodactylibacter sp.]